MSITITDIPVNDLISNPHNPRSGVGDVQELADSIRAQGLQQQLVVTPTTRQAAATSTAWSSATGAWPRAGSPVWSACRASYATWTSGRNAS